MDLLLFFALPIATIILAVVFQKIIKCPLLVAATAFAIYLIVTFAVFDASFLIFAIVYTILAYLAAIITKFICNFIGRNGFFRTINAERINTNTLNTNNIEINNNDDDDNDNDNNNEECCNCHCCNCNCHCCNSNCHCNHNCNNHNCNCNCNRNNRFY